MEFGKLGKGFLTLVLRGNLLDLASLGINNELDSCLNLMPNMEDSYTPRLSIIEFTNQTGACPKLLGRGKVMLSTTEPFPWPSQVFFPWVAGLEVVNTHPHSLAHEGTILEIRFCGPWVKQEGKWVDA